MEEETYYLEATRSGTVGGPLTTASYEDGLAGKIAVTNADGNVNDLIDGSKFVAAAVFDTEENIDTTVLPTGVLAFAHDTGRLTVGDDDAAGGQPVLPPRYLYDPTTGLVALVAVNTEEELEAAVVLQPGGNPAVTIGGGHIHLDGDSTVSGNGYVEGALSFSDYGGIAGTVSGEDAPTGLVGEFVESKVASSSAVTLTNGTPANVVSISLTAGDWDVTGIVSYSFEGLTPSAAHQAGISTTSATVPSDGRQTYVTSPSGDSTMSAVLSTRRVNVTSTTTVYAVATANFSEGTAKAFGQISARRVR